MIDTPYLVKRSHYEVSKDNRPYQALGAALQAWRSARREIVLAGPAGTGKSRAWLQKLHFCAQKYPGMRGLIVRKTRHSITQTAMVTYEKKVLPPGALDGFIHWSTTDQEYQYPNGSIIAVGGMDKPSKVMSSEWDMIYPQEATELFEEDWEALTTRLRNGVMPYQQLGGDCNPGPPTHWLKLRADRHATLMLESLHRDNPSVTKEYLETLDALTGVRRLRLRDGIWAATEGMVYDNWNRAIHIARSQQLIDWGIFWPNEMLNRWKVKHVFGAVDWGFTNPGVIQIWAIDNDGRMYLVHEVYQTKKSIGWWVEQACMLDRLYGGIEAFICDPAEPGNISDFRNAGLEAIAAKNDIIPGISAMRERLDLAGDGRPRLYVYEYSLKERDPARELEHQSCGFEQEIDALAWPQEKSGHELKETPVKLNDHSMDPARYLCMYLKSDTMINQLDIDTVNALQNYRGY